MQLSYWRTEQTYTEYLPCVGGVGLKVRVGLSCRLPGGEAPGDTVNSFGGPEFSLDKLVTDSDDSLGLVAVWIGFAENIENKNIYLFHVTLGLKVKTNNVRSHYHKYQMITSFNFSSNVM